MEYMDNIIAKVISGNATDSEKSSLNQWIQESEENRAYYQHKLLLWKLIGKVQKKPEVDISFAWERFNKKKQEKENKSFVIYKIAAVFSVLLISSYILFLLIDENKSAKIINASSIKSNNKKTTTTPLDLTKTNSDLENTYEIKRFQKRKDSSNTNQILLPDSSTVVLNSNSLLNVLKFTPNQPRIASLSGAGLFDIRSLDEEFVLETENLLIHVQGTKFNISTATETNKFVEISVEEGIMEVCEKINPSNKIMIKSKQKFLYDVEEHIFIEAPFNNKPISKWRKFVRGLFNKDKKLGYE